MFFPLVAAVAAAATQNPAWFLSGAYHPPLPGNAGNEGLHHRAGTESNEMGTEISGEALSVALDVVQAWAVLLTLGFTLVIFFFLAFCVCSKKDDGYDEFEISQGITTVKICHDGGENGVSLIPRINGSGTESMKATDETSEASSRYTLKRELPAIPVNAVTSERDEQEKSERPISQHSSDLYASVNESAQGSSSFKLIGGVQVLPAGALAPGGRAAVVKECVSSPEDQADGGITKKDATSTKEELPPYAQIKKGHPYSQVSKSEHPYAKVTTRKGQETETDTDSYDEPKAISKDRRKWESEHKYQSASSSISETHKESHLPPSSRYSDPSSKADTVTSPHSPTVPTSIKHSPTTTSSAIPPQSQAISGRSPTSCTRSPTSPSHSQAPPTSSVVIPAAMAISGQTPANDEMPYMTPPVLQPTREPQQQQQQQQQQQPQQQQQNFSGDSQDSRGYTSISVREPLAALKARQGAEGAIAALGRTSAGKEAQNQGSEGEGYYMTVSDDSADEMYACIYEGSRGAGSETYAQIEPQLQPQPQLQQQQQAPPPPPPPPSVLSASSSGSLLQTVTSPTGGGSGGFPLGRAVPQDPSPPAPPSVDSLRHVVHSRQASASSSASAGMGSPVAEKRGTRSPLPPLPQGDAGLYSPPPEPPAPLSSQPIPKSPPKSMAQFADKPTPRSLEEMYAKVLKKPHGHSRGSSSGAVEGSDASRNQTSRRGSAEFGGGRWSSTSPISSKPPPTQDMTHSLVESRTHDVSPVVNRAKSCDVSASWGGVSSDERKVLASSTRGNYEVIPPLYSGSDPGYETVKNGEPAYASVDRTENYPGYETVRGSDIESEPGYETLKQKDLEPGYETVLEVASKKSLSSEPGYESVSTTEYDEPGYETVSNKKSPDPGYESVQEKDKIEYDPGYEELSHPSLNRSVSESDPNYEQLKFTSWRSSGGENGYEVVSKGTVEGNYELVSDYESQGDGSRKSQLYEKEEVKDSTGDVIVGSDEKPKDDSDPKTADIPLYASVKKKGSPKKEKIEDSPALEEPKVEKYNENSNVIESPSTEISENADVTEKQDVSGVITSDDDDNNKDISATVVLALGDDVKEATNEPMNKDEKYQVMDSPEEVELPPPGGEDNHRISPPNSPEEVKEIVEIKEEVTEEIQETVPSENKQEDSNFIEPTPSVSLTFTEASPPLGSPETGSTKSSSSSASSARESKDFEDKEDAADIVESKDETVTEVEMPKAPPPDFDSPKYPEEIPVNSLEDSFPPPPLPVLDDDIATASPPPPPPPLPDEICAVQPADLPPPPLAQEPPLPIPTDQQEAVNGLSPTSPSDKADQVENFGACSTEGLSSSDLPAPLPSVPTDITSESPPSPKNIGCVNGSVNVTVNPMADIEDEEGSAPLSQPPLPPPVNETLQSSGIPVTAPSVESGESQSSGSTATNGNGSVESVVTVDPKKGSDPSTTVPSHETVLPPLQHSSSTSSSDSSSKHSDPNEGITPV